MPKPRVAVYTLGCKVNQHESETITGLFINRGYQPVSFEAQADVYLINTCTVTHLGDRKSRQMIRRAQRLNPEAVIAVTGCYAQTSPGEVASIPGVDLVIGTSDRQRIVELVEEATGSQAPLNLVQDIMAARNFEEINRGQTGGRVRATVKIQEGCEQFCTYCIVPYARGPSRSRPLARVVAEATQLVETGFKELVLTGTHIGTYGRDLSQPESLEQLVRELLQIPGLLRLRLSSIEANEVTPGLIEMTATSGIVCPHFHLPLQSGSDEILARMGRPYTTVQFAAIVADIRRQVPEVAITTDLIVGFPGETAELFRETVAFVEGINFSGMHVFPYSPRQGTPAAQMPNQVDPPTREARSKEMITLARYRARAFAAGFVGASLDVLVETAEDQVWEGHSANYLRVRCPAGDQPGRGQIFQIKIKDLTGDYLEGEIIGNNFE